MVPLAWVVSGAIDRFDPWIRGQGGQSSRTQVVAEVTRQVDATTEFSLSPFYVRRGLGLRQNFTGWLENPVDGDMTQQRNDASTLGATAWLRRRFAVFSEGDRFEVGGVVRSDTIDQSQRRIAWGTGRETATVVDAEVRATQIGGYLDASIHPIRRVALRGGARFDGVSYQVDDRGGGVSAGSRTAQGLHVGKKGTLDVTVGPGWHVLASYGEGFRSPQARSLGDGETAPFTTVQSYETGVRYSPDTRFHAFVSAFRSRLSRDLVFDHATGRNESVPGTTRTGATLDLVARPADWLLSMASLTVVRAAFRWSEGIYEEGTWLPYAPQVVARSDTAFRPVIEQLDNAPVQNHLGLGLTLLDRR
ncbi:MAG: TonB-dependent receptor, partial [Coriobacteriia bacterium]|nr:TonB-dependent receptor [Coriobacteriia bacterium]